jgi:thiol-disulfide isomerase/thioredoxin
MSIQLFMLNFKLGVLLITAFIHLNCWAQNASYPIVKEKCPDFHLTQVEHYSQTKVSLNDFKGKWLILDFWTKSCKACLESFPKLNELQTEFTNDIQFLLIAKNDKKYNKGIKELYEKYRIHYRLKLPIAYDTTLFELFGVQATPHIVIIDKTGFVRAVTFSSDLTGPKLKDLVDNKLPNFKKKTNAFEEVDPKERENVRGISYLFDDDRMGPFYFKSILTRWTRGMPFQIMTKIDQDIDHASYQTTATSLKRLYNVAFLGATDWTFGDSLYGIYWRYPIVEASDSMAFDIDLGKETGNYNYSLKVPRERANLEYMKWAMQCDLRKYFGFEVSCQIKEMPCWKLVVSDQTKIRLAEKDSQKGISIDNLLNLIWSYHQSEPPFIDSTNIAEPIYITLDAVMTDLSNIRQSLKNKGFDLILSKKLMNVLLISDGKLP